jgi:GT2 family glycosyltransferase
LKRTDYPSIEILIVDNGTIEPEAARILDKAKEDSRVSILREDSAFNYSRLNNLAVAQARGSIIVLLNNDTKVIHGDWLTELVSLVLQPQIGIAGAKLLNVKLRTQHAGLVYGPDSELTHQLCLLKDSEGGPEGELALLRQLSAVTGACLALRRELYLEIGGLNEDAFRIAYNDIDLCMRVVKRGLAIVWTPHARLLHFGCKSRGPTNRPGPADFEFSENMRFWQAYSDLYGKQDPFHNPQITFFYEHVELAQPPRPHPLRLECLLGARSPAPAFY